MGTNQIQVNLKFNADVQQAKQSMLDLQNSLRNLTTTDLSKSMGTMGLTQEIQEATAKVTQLKTQLEAATNVNTGKLNLKTFNTELKMSGNTLEQYKASLMALGPAGQQAFAQLARSVATAEAPFISLGARMEKTLTTLANTARWQLASSVINGLSGAMQRAYGYAQDLNKSLTDIRIVSGYGADEMAKFAESANKAAKALSATTTAYTNAALIYYQQGLSNAEVEERTATTIKMANVTGENAEAVSSYMTAIWNNFDDGSKSLEYYADVITALGAATAASSEEIAGGLEKFAAIGETIGLSYEYATAALTTIVAETRQSEDVVGTALKTIFARIQGLKLGESLEDGTDLNKYSEALATVGVNIKDTSGNLKDMDTILDEVGGKWNSLTKAEQMALAQTVAGVRQYTQFIALMDNYQDVFQENLNTAYNAEGSLEEQQEIYAESWEGASKRAQAAMQNIYQSLLNDEFFIKLTNMFAEMGEGLGEFLDNIGGAKTVLLLLGSIITQVFNQQIVAGITNAGNSIYSITKKGKAEMDSLRNSAFEMLKTLSNSEGLNNLYDQMAQFEQRIIQAKKTATEAEKQYYDQVLKTGRALFDQAIASQQVADAAKEKQQSKAQGYTEKIGGFVKEEITGHLNAMPGSEFQEQYQKAEVRKEALSQDYKQFSDIYGAGKQAYIKYGDANMDELGENKLEASYNNLQKKTTDIIDGAVQHSVDNKRLSDNEGNPLLKKDSAYSAEDIKLFQELETILQKDKKEMGEVEQALQKLKEAFKSAGAEADLLNEQFEFIGGEKGVSDFNERLKDNFVDPDSWDEEKGAFDAAAINSKGEVATGNAFQFLEEDKITQGLEKMQSSLIESTTELSKFQQLYNEVLGAGKIDLGIEDDDVDLQKATKSADALSKNISKIQKQKGFENLKKTLPSVANAMDKLQKEAQEVSTIDFKKLKGEELEAAKNRVKALQSSYESLGTSLGKEISKNSALKEALMNIFGPDVVNKWVEDARKGGEAAGKAMADGVKVFNTDDLEAQLQRGKQKINAFAQGLTDLSSSLMTVSMGIQALKSLGEIWSDEDLSTGEKLVQTMMSLSMIIPVVTMVLQNQTLAKMGSAIGDKALAIGTALVTKAKGAETAAVWANNAAWLANPIMWIALVIIGVVAAVLLLVNAIDKANSALSETERMDKLAENTEKMKSNLQEVRKEADELKATFDSYNSIQKTLKGLRRGTDEWKKSVSELNAQALELLEKYPELYTMVNDLGESAVVFKDGYYQIAGWAQEELIKETKVEALIAERTVQLAEAKIALSEVKVGLQEELKIEFGAIVGTLADAFEDIDEMFVDAAVEEGTPEWIANLLGVATEFVTETLPDWLIRLFTAGFMDLEELKDYIEQLFPGALESNATLTTTTDDESLDPVSLQDFKDNYTDTEWLNTTYGEVFQTLTEEQAAQLIQMSEDFAEIYGKSADETFQKIAGDIFLNSTQWQDAFNGYVDLWSDMNIKLGEAKAALDLNTRALGQAYAEEYVKDYDDMNLPTQNIVSEALGYKQTQAEEKFKITDDQWSSSGEFTVAGVKKATADYVEEYLKEMYGAKDVGAIQFGEDGTVTATVDGEAGQIFTREGIESYYAAKAGNYAVQNNAQTIASNLNNLNNTTAGSALIDIANDKTGISTLTREQVESLGGTIDENGNVTFKRDTNGAEGGLTKGTIEYEFSKAAKDAGFADSDGKNYGAEYAKSRGYDNAYDFINQELIPTLSNWNENDAYNARIAQTQQETDSVISAGAQATGMSEKGLESYADTIEDDLVAANEELSEALEEGAELTLEQQEALAKLEKTAAKMAVQEVKTAKAFDKTREVFEDYSDVLKEADEDSIEYNEAVGALAESLGEVFGTDISADFVKNEQNMKDLQAALDGDAEAFERLAIAASREVIANVDVSQLEGGQAAIDEFLKMHDELVKNIPDIKVGATLEGADQFMADAAAIVEGSQMSVDEANAYFRNLGFEPTFETKEIEVTSQEPITRRETVNIQQSTTPITDKDGNVLAEIPTFSTDTIEYVSGYTPVTSKKLVPKLTVENPNGEGGKTLDSGFNLVKSNASVAASGFTKSNGGSSGKSGGGGGGKGSKKKTQDKKKSKDEVERYHVINKQLDSMSKKLDDISKKKDRAFGPSRLKYMDQEIAAMQEQIKLQEQYNKEVEVNLTRDKAAIERYGAVFDADGNITNYEQIVENQLKEYNKAVDRFNASAQEEADDEALEKAEEKYDEFKEILEQYEETNELSVDVQADLTDLYNQLDDLELEKITYEIEYKIEIDDSQLEYLEFLLNRVNDEAFEAANAIGYLGDQTELTFNKLNTLLSGIDEIMAREGVSEADYTKFMQGDDSVLENYAGITENEREQIKQWRSEMISLNEELFDIQETVQGKVLETFQAWTDEIETQIELFDKYTSTLEHYRNIIDIVGKDTLGISNKTLNELRDAQREVLHDRMRATKAELEAVTASRERVEQAIADARARGDETSAKSFENDLKEIQAKENELLLDLQAQLEESLQLSKDKFIEATDEMIQDFKDSIAELFGEFELMKTQYEHFTEKRENYLADYKKMYELNKLNNNLQKSIDETDNIKAKQMLSELQDEINEKMADSSKMTQYELDYLTKKLEVKKAEIALEEAQNAKSQVRLVRQSTGEYGYMYTADQAKIDEAKQNLETKIFELTELTQNYIKEQENQAIELVENMVSEFETIKQMRADDLIDDQQFEEMMEQTRSHYMEQLKLTQVNMEQAMTNAKNFYNNDAEAYEELIGYKFANDDSYLDHFNETFLSQLGDGYNSWGEMYRDIADESAEMLNEMAEASDELQENFEEDMQEAGHSMDTFADEIEEGMETVQTEAERTADTVEDMSSSMKSSFNDTVGAVEDWQRAYSEAINTVITDIRSLVQAQNELNNIKSPKKEEKKEEKPKETTADKGGSSSDKKIITDDQIKGIAAAIWYDGHASGWGNWPIRKETLESKFGKGSYEKLQDYINSCIAKDGGKTMYNYGVQLGKSGRKKYYYSSFDTGGYTGSWGNEGRLAMLHQKELVLNAKDTENMLSAVSIVRDLLKEIDLRAVSAIVGATSLTPGITPAMAQTLEQDVTIHAEFPNVQDRNEIEEAFKTLVNEASQYANRKR